jgi:hypothetical protein
MTELAVGGDPPSQKIVFDYGLLEPDSAAHLRQLADQIYELQAEHDQHLDNARESIQRAHSCKVHIGDCLIEAKEGHPGDFMRWREAMFTFSQSMANKLMNVARRWRELPDNVTRDMFTLYGLFRLSGANVPDEIRKLAERRANKGVRLSKIEADILAEAPPEILERYTERRELTQKQTYRLVKVYNRAEPEVQTITLAQQVSDGDVVLEMGKWFRNRHKKRSDGQLSTWERMQDKGWYLDHAGVHISEANQRDIDRDRAERAEEHRERALVEREATSVQFAGAVTVTDINDGRIVLSGLDLPLEMVNRRGHLFLRFQDD